MMNVSCKARVHHAGSWSVGRCSRMSVTPDGFCKQHSPEAEAARREASDARYKIESAKRNRMWARQRVAGRAMDVLRTIASGHNDPRQIAKELVDEYDSYKEPEEA